MSATSRRTRRQLNDGIAWSYPLSHNDVASIRGYTIGAIHDPNHSEGFRSHSFLTAFLHVAPLFAATVGYVSSTGSDCNLCTAAAPCATFIKASQVWEGSGGEIACLDFPSISEVNVGISSNVTFDCVGVLNATGADAAPITLQQGGILKIRNLTISGTGGGYPAIRVNGGGTLVPRTAFLRI